MTATPFVAVVRTGTSLVQPAHPAFPALRAAGATAVLSWSDLAASTDPDETPTVLFDLGESSADPSGLDRLDDLTAALGALSGDRDDVVVVTVRPVTDTLKLVDADGVVTGTAERDEHRFVGTPIAARLELLRALSRETDDAAPVTVLAALAARGATVLGSRS